MAVVKEFTLPDLGEGLTEAEIVRWLVEVGEVVAVDQPVVEVETAKAVVEVPCPYAGVVTARFGDEGETMAVGRPLVTVAVGSGDGTRRDLGSEDPGPGGPRSERGAADGSNDEGSGDEGSGNVLVGYGTGPAARRRKRVRGIGTAANDSAGAAAAVARSVPEAVAVPVESGGAGGPAEVSPGGPGARFPGREASAARDGGPVAVISPLVRRLAREQGLDLRAVDGTGPDGLILRADVQRAVARLADPADPADLADEQVRGLPRAQAPGGARSQGRAEPAGPAEPRAQPPTPAPAPGSVPAGASRRGVAAVAERVPLRGVRGAVAEKLARSRREIPDATCWVDADATELVAARAVMNAAAQAAGAERISVLALLARISTAALARYPELNATVDTERGEIVRLPAVHLGFAAQTERGLMVPVLRDAQSRTTAGLSAEIGRLTRAARDGSLTPGELTGGTFTLNNYGVFGVDGSTPIINHPEAAMLGVGRIVPKPWVREGELAVRQVVQLSFTFDHRVCDGAAAGGFLRFVADCVESPAVLLSAV
ncbi:dihydrolipoamide acetyltransferase family protein [Actinacidiphila sp. ITFR-21]|uniref:dihydrolipoamide acetyltransferase family protein n=1 Tax=Actinacidiphila sp. ITFR-21 TaxID=3075199 RepID=UPI002889B523|nr:dihydrolipoamide acetyltransferase family protein [Streptomyces sp. ITFR-21]WNI16716.1 dihydrolipoamide acetyltransferase family protein [Streptomyces sp. ITFR-21]